jgi:acyl-CoA ligase (AMP-forming) (exosortase A-associated)
MIESTLLHELVHVAAQRNPAAPALTFAGRTIDYAALAADVAGFASGLLALTVRRAERVGIYLEKRFETVVASFGAPAAGAVFVPLNPLLKADQVGFIVRDCDVRVLVTSPDRLVLLAPMLGDCPSLQFVISTEPMTRPDALSSHIQVLDWQQLLGAPPRPGHRVVDTDVAAILYTSGSTGKPKGVVLSHRNMVAGGKSVASYLDNRPSDTLLAALPLSFDAGFSQLTTGFHAGARVVLLNYLMPRDVLRALTEEKVTGLTAVPPLYIQLSTLQWPASVNDHLRYFANTGGRMPRDTLMALRAHVPAARPYLMYGLTEAFRSTYLPPEEVDRRPDSIGKAIPNAEILVLRPDGAECEVDEVGELVHRGPLVGQGYWNDPDKTAERYRLMPNRPAGLQLPEFAVFSGDFVRRDAEGFLYFVGRRDEMIKTSGYRISPTEIEEIIYTTQRVGECAAFGVDHPTWGQAIHVVVTPPKGLEDVDVPSLLADCRLQMPAYMIPSAVEVRPGPLPRNANGKIDRKLLSTQLSERALAPDH